MDRDTRQTETGRVVELSQASGSKKRHGETADHADDADKEETRTNTIREIRGHKVLRPDAFLSALRAKVKCGACKESKVRKRNVMHFERPDQR